MDITFQLVILLVISYLIGSVPSGVIISRLFFGFDIRTKGSGNMGSTNVFRVLGRKWGIIVQIADILKGVLPVMIAIWLFGSESILYQLLAGISSVTGHIFPLFSGFKGGKGINTLAGMLIAISPNDTLPALGVFLIAFLSTGIVSLGSILAAVTITVSLLVRNYLIDNGVEGFLVLLPFFTAISVLVLITHRRNISRLLKGNENRFSLPWLKGNKND
jgi:glycerol-3-phosphate acyltransferase PlsY